MCKSGVPIIKLVRLIWLSKSSSKLLLLALREAPMTQFRYSPFRMERFSTRLSKRLSLINWYRSVLFLLQFSKQTASYQKFISIHRHHTTSSYEGFLIAQKFEIIISQVLGAWHISHNALFMLHTEFINLKFSRLQISQIEFRLLYPTRVQ
mgnify:CR=1 FL=1